MKLTKTLLIPTLCASLLAAGLPAAPAFAAPAFVTPGVGVSSSVEPVYYRGRGRGYRRGAGLGIVGGIIAGTLIAAAISEGRARDPDLRACARDFPEFDPRRGTYIDRYGDERICPYLR